MQRINGFIDLDCYYQGLSTNELLDEKIIIPSEYSMSHFWLKIDGKFYYFKPTTYYYNELICHEIARALGIESIEYDLATFHKEKGVISPSYRKDGCKYISGSKILRDYYHSCKDTIIDMGLDEKKWKKKYRSPAYGPMNNLEIIWQALSFKYQHLDSQEVTSCMIKIILQLIFVILTVQYDKGPYNWEVEEYENAINIVPLFDNEASFSKGNLGTEMSTGFKDFTKSQYEILERFLMISSKEYVDLFLEKFNILTENRLYEIFKVVEDKIHAEIPQNIKEQLMASFVSNRLNIENILKKLNIEYTIGRV